MTWIVLDCCPRVMKSGKEYEEFRRLVYGEPKTSMIDRDGNLITAFNSHKYGRNSFIKFSMYKGLDGKKTSSSDKERDY